MATETTIAIPVLTGGSQGNVDVAQISTSAIPAATVLRENIVVADPTNFVGQAQVTNARGLQVDTQMIDMMQAILIELRCISSILADGLNLNYGPEQWRNDNSLITDIEQ